MKRWPLLLAVVVCAACAPVVYVTPSAGGDVLPVEAQRVIDRATATAAAAATEAAQATAARVSTQQALQNAQDQATLAAGQTQAALTVTLQIAAATQAAGQTQVWASPTYAAMATNAALARGAQYATATQIAAAADRSRADADAWRNFIGGLVIVSILAAIAVAGILVYFVFLRQNARQETFEQIEAEKVDRARAQTDREIVELDRVRAELMKAMMIERDGRPYLIGPGGRLVPMLPGGTEPVPQSNRAGHWRWRAALKRAVYCGIELGRHERRPRFGERDLAGAEVGQAWVVNPDGTPSSAGYRKLNKVLRRAGVWTTSGRDTTWGPGWDEERFERDFDATPLLELPEGEPPEVRIPHRSSAVAAVVHSSAVPQSD